MVTDPDAHLTQQALALLSAKLTRRERMLAAAGAKDIEQYAKRAGREPRPRSLPRLVIVIDEFASPSCPVRCGPTRCRSSRARTSRTPRLSGSTQVV
jgi:hypothetical protein